LGNVNVAYDRIKQSVCYTKILASNTKIVS